MSTTGHIFTGRDNVVTLLVADNDTPVDLSSATDVQVTIDGITKSSAADPDLFDLSELVNGKIGLAFGSVTELTEAVHKIRVVTIDLGNPNGLIWVHEEQALGTSVRVIKDGE